MLRGKGQVSAGLGGRTSFSRAPPLLRYHEQGAVGGRFIYSVKERRGRGGGSSDLGAPATRPLLFAALTCDDVIMSASDSADWSSCPTAGGCFEICLLFS